MNQEAEDSASSNMKHQPPPAEGGSSDGKLISSKAATSTDPIAAATSGCILERSQSAENLQTDPASEKVSHNDSGVSGSESPTIETIPSVTSPTYPAHCSATVPTRSITRIGVPFPLHLLRSNSASADDEIKYRWTRSLFGKALADYLASEFDWQAPSDCQNLATSHERDHNQQFSPERMKQQAA
jgi:hypothetical protein